MKKTLLLVLTGLFFCSLQGSAQVMTGTDGGENMVVEKLDAEVRIHGFLAETTMTMTFRNPMARQRIGNLYFPLPEKGVLSGFALDVNGQMIDGVVVQKDQARQVFEKISRRRIDPGLVEWVQGNCFKTRVYPMPASGTRKVQVRFLSELPYIDGHYVYQMPLNFKSVISDVNVTLVVENQNHLPELVGPFYGKLSLEKISSSFKAKANFKLLRLDEDFFVKVPAPRTPIKIIEKSKAGKYYFCINDFPVLPKKQAIPFPKVITLLWDASSSAGKGNLKRQFAVLKEFFNKYSSRNIQVKLVVFRDVVESTRVFRVVNGNWNKLREVLKLTQYDGATNLHTALASNIFIGSNMALLFTDGIASYGERIKSSCYVPLYTFASGKNTDSTFLAGLSEKVGGGFFNLSITSAKGVMERLGCRSYQSKATADVYPKSHRNVYDSFSAAGCTDVKPTEIIFRYGFGYAELSESTTKSHSMHNVPLSKGNLIKTYYGLKKVEELMRDVDGNIEALIATGKEFGLVTPGTSLISLDNVDQYVRYRIEPPVALPVLRDEYLKRVLAMPAPKVDDGVKTLNQAAKKWGEFCTWYQKDYNYPVGYRCSFEKYLFQIPTTVKPSFFRGVIGLGGAGDEEGSDTFFGDDSEDDLDWGGDEEVDDEEVDDGEEEWEDEDEGDEEESAAVIRESSIEVTPWTSDTLYLREMEQAGEEAYSKYLVTKRLFTKSSTFYVDCADFFHKKGNKVLALRIISNLAELYPDDVVFLRILGHRLRQMKQFPTAVKVFEKILKLRPGQPQSYRDLALAYAGCKQYEKAVKLLHNTLSRSWTERFDQENREMAKMIMILEMNRIITLAGGAEKFLFVDERFVYPMQFDVRIVLTWDSDQTDMDLNVIEPSGEACDFYNRRTFIGGYMSPNFTQGYGPEQYLIKKGMDGQYLIKSKYIGSRSQELIGPVNVQVDIFTGYGTAEEKHQSVSVRLSGRDGMREIGKVLYSTLNKKTKAKRPAQYIVLPNDTPLAIAAKLRKWGCKWQDLVKANQGINLTNIEKGQMIVVPAN